MTTTEMAPMNQSVVMVDHDPDDKGPSPAHSRPHFKSTLAQCFGTVVSSLSFIMVGIFFTIPTVVIGDDSGDGSSLQLTTEEKSWYASLLLMTQPIGCLTGGFLQTFMGRKYGMLLMNVLAILTLIFINQVQSVNMLYISSVLMGITVGFVEAPGLTYVTEITEPRIRGTLAAFTNFSVSIGFLLTFILPLITNWRNAALITVAIPVLTLLLLFFVPDSPYWLLNKGKEEEALKALCWLRGWVAEEDVKAEFEGLHNYIKITHAADGTQASAAGKFRIRYLFEASTLRPMILLLGYQFFYQCASAGGSRNYLIKILEKLNLPITPKKAIIIITVIGVAANLINVITVNFVGKRLLSLTSMMLTSLSTMAIGVAIWYRSDMPSFSFIVLFAIENFFALLGISPLPWVLLGEMFSIKSRSIAAGITGAAYYLIMSLFTKTYPDLEKMFDTQGYFILCSLLGLVGFVFLWRFLPETEGKTLSEIEEFFSNKKGRQRQDWT